MDHQLLLRLTFLIMYKTDTVLISKVPVFGGVTSSLCCGYGFLKTWKLRDRALFSPTAGWNIYNSDSPYMKAISFDALKEQTILKTLYWGNEYTRIWMDMIQTNKQKCLWPSNSCFWSSTKFSKHRKYRKPKNKTSSHFLLLSSTNM